MDSSWTTLLQSVITNKDFMDTQRKISEMRKEREIYPPEGDMYNAFKLPFENVKVVILGQDPYHGEGQAHGLAFSVNNGQALPPSLKNIFKEAMDRIPKSGDLSSWQSQGVLLLNTVLTVEKKIPKSHSRMGWQMLTQEVLRLLVEKNDHIVFMLWGRDAQNQVGGLNFKKTQLILRAAHPSPLGAHHHAPIPFKNCNHFKLANEYFKCHNITEINWEVES